MLIKMGWKEGEGLGRKRQGDPLHVQLNSQDSKAATLGLGNITDRSGRSALTASLGGLDDVLASLTAIHAQPAAAPSSAARASSSASSQGAEAATTSTSTSRRPAGKIAYNRFLRNKDASSYSAADMAAILGRTEDAMGSSAAAAWPVIAGHVAPGQDDQTSSDSSSPAQQSGTKRSRSDAPTAARKADKEKKKHKSSKKDKKSKKAKKSA